MLEPQDLSQSGEYWKWLGKQDCELMQFTGPLDKNGKEIYEGDVVRCFNGKSYPATILWGHGGFEMKWQTENIRTSLLGGMQERIIANVALDATIIGNIFETPELGE